MIAIEIAGARVHVPEGVDAKTLSVVSGTATTPTKLRGVR
jgi:hypothetical protein